MKISMTGAEKVAAHTQYLFDRMQQESPKEWQAMLDNPRLMLNIRTTLEWLRKIQHGEVVIADVPGDDKPFDAEQ